ncbi:MAG: hypothetical protein QXZ25_04570 [Candidatus Bathyarchaeia archaeon]|nr:hypothetical protein [Candidatus Jingweiarchaeum tengchongense]
MIQTIELLPVFVDLTQKYPSLIFWKHFERALSGKGDVDSIAPRCELACISRSFRELAFAKIPQVYAILESSYLENTKMNFVITHGNFPKLLEFDIGSIQSRLGIAWALPEKLIEFTTINQYGVRVLKPGSQSVVLLVLYALNRRGENKLSRNDYDELLSGIRSDYQSCMKTIESLFPPKLSEPLFRVVNFLYHGHWDSVAIRKAWRSVFLAGISQLLLNPVRMWKALKGKKREFFLHFSHRLSIDRETKFASVDNLLRYYAKKSKYKVFVRASKNSFIEVE